jgi:hypothetical protein
MVGIILGNKMLKSMETMDGLNKTYDKLGKY